MDSLSRPKHILTLHLGRVPNAVAETPPPYDASQPLMYYRASAVETMFSGRVTRLLETRGNWLIRQITIGETITRNEHAHPSWTETTGLEISNSAVFHRVWDIADED